MYRRRIDRQDGRRRGSLTLELLLVLPILMTVVLAAFEFSMLAQVRQQLLNASRDGARSAGHRSATNRAAATQRRADGVKSRAHS